MNCPQEDHGTHLVHHDGLLDVLNKLLLDDAAIVFALTHVALPDLNTAVTGQVTG